MEEYYNNIDIKAGETFVLDKPSLIEGDITIERGGYCLLTGLM